MPNLCKLGDVFLTIVEEEEYNYSNDITERAMEDGSKVTDHAKSNLITINISGIIKGKGMYPQEELTKLRMYCLNRNVLKYIGVQKFGSCMIESFSNVHDIKNGISFNITLKEIRIVKKTSIAVNTGKLNIPDIERLKEQLEEQKKSKQSANTKLKTKTNQGRKTKQPKKGKESKLQKILNR